MIKCFLIGGLLLASFNIGFGQSVSASNDQLTKVRVQDVYFQLRDQAKALDEPALRVFLRLRGAAFLWNTGFAEVSEGAETLAVDALNELKDHENEIPPAYARSFRSQLMALLRLHAPVAAERISKKYSLQIDNQDQVNNAYSMLNAKDTASALATLNQSLKNGQDPGPDIIFFFDKLQKEKPEEAPRLLSEMLSLEEQRPGSLSSKTLSYLSSYYLNERVSLELKNRFLAVGVNSTLNSAAWTDAEQLLFAYSLLLDLAPVAQKLNPPLFSRASAQLASLSARIPQAQLERITVEKRISQSADPLNELITEANSAKDTPQKDSFLAEAAQLALKDGQLKKAIDLTASISTEGEMRLWRDQFLVDAAGKALEKNDVEVADYAASKTQSPLNHATILQKIATHLFESGDSVRAREFLSGAIKLIDSGENNADKAAALMRLIPTCMKIDESQVTQVTQSMVKVINNIPTPSPEDKSGSTAHNKYVQTLLGLAQGIIPIFQSLARKNEVATLSIAKDILRPEIRSAAVFGANTGALAKDITATVSAMSK